MLEIQEEILNKIYSHLIKSLPNEGCLILGGTRLKGSSHVSCVFEVRNKDNSAVSYSIDPLDFLKVDREIELLKIDIIGIVHSHTHSDPYPSKTDVLNAIDPNWYYLIVSLRHREIASRAFKISGSEIYEEEIKLCTESR